MPQALTVEQEIGQQIKILRLSKRFSQDDLVKALGGMVTKQALSKYENGKMKPSVSVARGLAKVLGVQPIQLLTAPRFQVEFLAYRRRSGMLVRDHNETEGYVQAQLQERVRIQERLEGINTQPLPRFQVKSFEDVEQAAKDLRRVWDLGLDAISSITDLLETHRIHVLLIRATQKFDGLSAWVRDAQGVVIGAGVVSRDDVAGEHLRMNLAHELGHLVLEIVGLDVEKTVTRFAGAFLMPDQAVQLELGGKRAELNVEELLLIKQRFGISIQAIVMRASAVGLISETLKTNFFKYVSQQGWRTQEPQALIAEEPRRWKQLILRGLTERLLSPQEASVYLSPEEIERSGVVELPNMQSRQQRIVQMQKAAEQMVSYYEKGTEGAEWADEYVRTAGEHEAW
jgi:Zn-dependent peptidase ImmA (M78 family)/DNA-binding XRE family transcriptional regulator